jgi:NAD(P)-dependent dehydrogenase (short-subunit alcohol dehydrogenase family)
VFDIHVRVTVNTNQAAFEHLKAAGRGAIVNFVPIAGIRGMRGFAIYGAAKGAVLAWTHNAALEWGAHEIRVNAVVLAMDTGIVHQSRGALDAEGLARLNAETRAAMPLRAAVENPGRNLAPFIAFLIWDGSSYIPGQAIAVDSGTMMPGSCSSDGLISERAHIDHEAEPYVTLVEPL